MYKNISFFKGLNELRFFAASLVVLHHSETIRNKNLLFNLEWISFFRNGTNAVNFFFVLSGFLITYLLLKENRVTNDISIKRFYLKRVLRIWPLYFLLFFIGTVFLPLSFNLLGTDYQMPYSFGQVWYYYVFFTPALVLFFYGHHFLEPLWSIGVEEIFYLLWAPLFKFFKKYIVGILFSVIVLKVILLSWAEVYLPKNGLLYFVFNIHSFELMAIGGLGAYYIFNSSKKVSEFFLFRKPIQLIVYAVLLIYLFANLNIDSGLWNFVFKTPVLSTLIVGLMYLYTIIGVSISENNVLRLSNKWLSYLGEISYGVYMYHMTMIFLAMLVLKKHLLGLTPVVGTLVFYGFVFGGTILVSALSKRYFEDFFLKNIKNKIIKQKN